MPEKKKSKKSKGLSKKKKALLAEMQRLVRIGVKIDVYVYMFTSVYDEALCVIMGIGII